MTQPQQPELRRSGGGANDEDLGVIPESVSSTKSGGRPHGMDKGNKGGGEGGGVPPDQSPPHPS